MAEGAKVIGAERAPCVCKNKFQDERYGSGMRIHNRGPKASPNKTPGKKCTVCGRATNI